MKNRLKFNKCYLIGPMDHDRDKGRGWREDMTIFLKEKLQVIPFDPYHKPLHDCQKSGLEDDDNHRLIREYREAGNWDKVRELSKPFVHLDLRMVDFAEFIIANVDMEQKPCGTFDEMFMAAHERKPIIVHAANGKKELPPWLFGRLRHELFFETWEEIKNYLYHIAFDDVIDDLGKWKFFDIEDDIMDIVRQEYTCYNTKQLQEAYRLFTITKEGNKP